MKKFIYFVLILFNISYAKSDGGYAGSFLRYGLDARGEAMGRAMAADDNNGFSIFYNPALAGFLNKKTILLNYRFLSMDRKFSYVGYSAPLAGKGGFSVGYLYSGTDNIEARDFDGNQFDTYSFNENMFHLSFGLKLKKFISFGLTAKVLYARFPKFDGAKETVSSNSFAIDGGFFFKLPLNVKLGTAVRNIKGKYSWSSGKVWSEGSEKIDYFPQTYDISLSWVPPFNNGIVFNLGYEISENKNSKLKGGFEYFKKFENEMKLFLRAGTYNSTPATGIGFQFKIYGIESILDYSYSFEDLSEFNPHTLSWMFNI